MVDPLEAATGEKVFIVFPWVYGSDQKRILLEETEGCPQLRRRVLLSEPLGRCLKPLLYPGTGFNASFSAYVGAYPQMRKEIAGVLESRTPMEDLSGVRHPVDGKRIQLEISRNPVISTGISRSYYTGVGLFSRILEAVRESDGMKSIDENLLARGIPVVREMESGFRLHFLPKLGCLSFNPAQARIEASVVETPPLISPPAFGRQGNPRGVYVSCSGIDGVRDIYDAVLRLPGTVYTNRPYPGIPNRRVQPPGMIRHPAITHVFARAAWNTIWVANLAGKCLICPEYHDGEHPEIFFNLKTVRKFGLGRIWDRKRVPIEDFLSRIPDAPSPDIRRIYARQEKEFGTLDGIAYCATRIIGDFLDGR